MTKLTRWAGNGLVAVALGVTLDMVASAASVTIDRVVQRWPWNNKVDITYTVTDAQNREQGRYYGIDFALSANGQTYAFEGNALGASTETGGSGSRQYTVTWTAPEGIHCSDASLTATLVATNVPSGTDYMIIDLTTGGITYEGLCATQGESNTRYNTAEFKTDKMVLRKVPRTTDSASLPNGPFASGYPTGHSEASTGNDANTPHRWTTDRDYYIGVFLVTQRQYYDIYGSNPSLCTSVIAGNEVAHRPVENVSWRDLRANASPTDQIPAVSAANTGSFFQRLNYKTGLYFDLPTEVMYEIAARAGATTVYFWGDTMDEAYVVSSENAGGSTVAVGSRLPNDWGLYDTAGNLWDRTRDTRDKGEMSSRSDAFTPGVGVSDQVGRIRLRGGHWNCSKTHNYFRGSQRDCTCDTTSIGNEVGFRVSVVVE